MSKLSPTGEQPIENAPIIELDNGAGCIPQHYLSYCHSIATIEQIIANCAFDNDYLLMAGHDSSGLYIQIGIIGFDTYRSPKRQETKKVVYGRRWRIEPYFPTSELIQTIYLAIKKAREHEIRERLKINVDGKCSAPFSSHQDLPLICNQFDELSAIEHHYSFEQFRRALVKFAKSIRFDHSSLQLLNIEKRYRDTIAIDIKFIASEWSEMPETQNAILTVMIKKPGIDLFLHELMDALIKHSDDYVAENFLYNNVPRFSKSVNPLRIAQLSQQVRRKLPQPEHQEFYIRLAEHNECVDKLRAPTLVGKKIIEGVMQKLEMYDQGIIGFLPETRFE